jgi:hypothetical protein
MGMLRPLSEAFSIDAVSNVLVGGKLVTTNGGFDQLRSNHHRHRHPKLHRTTLCVTGPRNQVKTSN